MGQGAFRAAVRPARCRRAARGDEPDRGIRTGRRRGRCVGAVGALAAAPGLPGQHRDHDSRCGAGAFGAGIGGRARSGPADRRPEDSGSAPPALPVCGDAVGAVGVRLGGGGLCGAADTDCPNTSGRSHRFFRAVLPSVPGLRFHRPDAGAQARPGGHRPGSASSGWRWSPWVWHSPRSPHTSSPSHWC
ncbi:Uncharacterised protein [Mycobacteroides abscessus subsp. abscessus]|nr:Uncharacterised protein [Mycobacteroides abscessus subsp. abscessus]